MISEDTRECVDCGEKKPIHYFERYTEDERLRRCKDCVELAGRKYRDEARNLKTYKPPMTCNSWPFYGTGDRFKVIPPEWHFLYSTLIKIKEAEPKK